MDESLRDIERQFSQNPQHHPYREQLAAAYQRQGRLLDAWRLIRHIEEGRGREELSRGMWLEQKGWIEKQGLTTGALLPWIPSAQGALSADKGSPLNSLLKSDRQGHIKQITLAPPGPKAIPPFPPDFPYITELHGSASFRGQEKAPGLTQWLSGMPSLESFKGQKGSKWWPILPHWPQLKRLSMHFLSLSSTEELQRFTQLRSFEIACFELSCPRERMNNLPEIKHLGLQSILRPERYVYHSFVLKLHALESLSLGFAHFDSEFELLNQLPSLKQLSLHGEHFKVARLRKINALKQLESLTLRECQLDTEGMEGLLQFPRLRSLSLRKARFTEGALEKLEGLRELENLDLSQTFVENDDLINLKRLPSLKRLWLHDCSRLTGRRSAEALSDLPQLEELDISRSPTFPQRFQELRPDVLIIDPRERPFLKYARLEFSA